MSVDVSKTSFSFRAPEPLKPAAELLAEIRGRGGRVYRMRSLRVFCLTDDPELAEWLTARGGKGYVPNGADRRFVDGAFQRARASLGGKIEYDLWIHTIPVEGDLWEAAG
jgi:hypothetical protein